MNNYIDNRITDLSDGVVPERLYVSAAQGTAQQSENLPIQKSPTRLKRLGAFVIAGGGSRTFDFDSNDPAYVTIVGTVTPVMVISDGSVGSVFSSHQVGSMIVRRWRGDNIVISNVSGANLTVSVILHDEIDAIFMA